MGYTHYWYRPKTLPLKAMRAIVKDFNAIIPKLMEADIKLADWQGEDVPTITPEEICFNGLAACGHNSNSNISIPWPTAEAGGVTEDSTHAIAGSWFAGSMQLPTLHTRTCNGDCSYETFMLPRSISDNREHPITDASRPENGLYFSCCKTAFRPYDIAVTACLLIAKHHLGGQIKVSTDGRDANWWDAKMLCQHTLGYGLEYQIDGDYELLLASAPTPEAA